MMRLVLWALVDIVLMLLVSIAAFSLLLVMVSYMTTWIGTFGILSLILVVIGIAVYVTQTKQKE